MSLLTCGVRQVVVAADRITQCQGQGCPAGAPVSLPHHSRAMSPCIRCVLYVNTLTLQVTYNLLVAALTGFTPRLFTDHFDMSCL